MVYNQVSQRQAYDAEQENIGHLSSSSFFQFLQTHNNK